MEVEYQAGQTVCVRSGAASRSTLYTFCRPAGKPGLKFRHFLVVGAPLILKLAGVADIEPKAITLTADFNLPRPDRRREFLRARINDAGKLELYANQSSAVLTSTVWGHGLIDNPPGGAIEPGQPVRFLSFDELLN